MKSRSFLLLALIALISCDSADPGFDGPGIVNGIDLDPLFAPPTAAEVQVVKDEWAGRDTGVHGLVVELDEQSEIAREDMRVRVVSHQVAGKRHFGAVLVPEGATDGSLPVLMYLHGGDGGVSVDSEVDFVLQFFADLRSQFVVVVPSFRDEPLRYSGRVWQSEGPPSPWDYDVDDALALLNVALEIAPEADGERVAAFGMSRGGAVAMLMAARDARVDQVVEFFGPTDFFGKFVQEVTIEALEGRPRNLPGLDFMNANYLQPLARGELSAVSLRTQIVRRSAVLFVEDMGRVQAHHGDADQIVPVSQAELLIEAMARAGKRSPEFDGWIYEGGEHNPITLPGAFDRAIESLRPLVR